MPSGGSRRNAEQAEAFTDGRWRVSSSRRFLLSDAMTSGGLLVSVAEKDASRAPGDLIGRLTEGPVGKVLVRAAAPSAPSRTSRPAAG